MSILKLIPPNMYFTKIGCNDAYNTIPLYQDHQRYLTFTSKEKLYKFTCLQNGYFYGPKKFVKALKPLLSTLI